MKKVLYPVLIFILLFTHVSLYAQDKGGKSMAVSPERGVKCIDSTGEAAILGNDVPSAKAEALARAKWNAIEEILGVEVRAQSVVQDMALVDDAVSKEIKGFVKNFKVLGEEKGIDTYRVKLNVCVEPSLAENAIGKIALNNSVAVFIPARKPRLVSENIDISRDKKRYGFRAEDEFEESNVLSETLTGKLTEQGFTVIEVEPQEPSDVKEIEDAIRTGRFLTVKSLIYKYLANTLILGKVDYTISTKRGEDIGYGISMPFHHVTVRLTYRIVTRDIDTGKMVVLHAGSSEAKGIAPNLEDAALKGMKALAEKITPEIVDKLSGHIKGIAKMIDVKVIDIRDTNTNFEVKGIIENIAWVMEVKEKALGEFVVKYPENAVYLANSLSQKGFELVNFSPYSITLKYIDRR